MKIQRTPEFKEWFDAQTEKSKAQVDARLKNVQKKILKKPGKSSKGKPLRQDYKAGTDVSIAGLKSAIIAALFEVDFDTFKGCIALLLDKCDYKEITKKTGLSKSTLYRMCEPDSNPTLENISKILNFIDYLDEKNRCLKMEFKIMLRKSI